MIRTRKVEFAGDQFYKAIGDIDLELVQAFLDAGMSARNPFPFAGNETPLTVAVSGQACSPAQRPTAPATVSIVQRLIARGADASLADEHGNTPLMQASMGGCDAVIMGALLQAGARINALVAAGYRLPAEVGRDDARSRRGPHAGSQVRAQPETRAVRLKRLAARHGIGQIRLKRQAVVGRDRDRCLTGIPQLVHG